MFQVLYVVRSPHPPSGFLETVVYSDRGGLQCPEPLLPVSQLLYGVPYLAFFVCVACLFLLLDLPVMGR